MPKYFSGRVKRTPQGSLTTDRYQYLGLNQAEPNLGDPPELENIPAGQRYQIVSVEDAPGKRFWIPLGGGVTPGSITVRDEGNIVPNVSASSSISDLDFKGSAVNVTGFLKQDGTPGTAVTITVAPPGLDHQVLFNDNGDFGAASRLIYDNNSNKVGIGSTQPEQDLDLLGNFKISGDLYDKDNDPGTTNQVLVKSATGGLEWADQSIDGVASAGGTITQVQYHNALGKVDGASNFVFDYNNNRVGIGSTQPTKLLDVLGESKFTGNLEVIGITTFVGDVFVQGVVTTEDVTNIDSLGIVTARKGLRTTDGGLIVVGVTTLQTTRLPDNTSLFLGSNDDLQLVHDGSNSIINDNGDGSLVLQQAGSTKLEVTGTGVTVTGVTSTTDLFVEDKVESNLIPDNTGGSKDLGSASNRWGTVYADVFNGADFNPTVIVTEQLKVTGVSTFEGDVFATGVANTFTKRLDVGMGGTVFTAINQAGIGSVGIGSSAPSSKLDVQGDINFNNNALISSNAEPAGNNIDHIWHSDINNYYGTGGVWNFVSDSTYKAVGNSAIRIGYLISSGGHLFGNVGIGTTIPTDPVTSLNTTKLAVGIVTANEFYGTLIGAAQSLSGGSAYKIPYQSGNSQTAFIDNGTSTGQLLQFNLGSAPSWVSPLGLTVENATNVIGGIGDLIQLNVSPGISTLTNLRVTGISTLTHLRVSGVSTFVDDIFVGTGATVGFGSTAYFRDQAGIHLGDSEDLRIFHGTSPNNPTTTDQHSYIQDTGTGDLVILSNQVAIRNAAETEDMARFYEGDRVELRFDNTLRFQTTNDGVKIGGGLQDKDGELGTNGQLLSSTGSELDWVSPAGLTVENANKVGVGSINTGVTNATYNITVTAPTSAYYTLSGSDRNGTVNGNNQPVTLKVGDTINFNLSNVNAIHPFYIRVSSNGANVSTPAATGQGSTGNNTVSWTPNTAGTYVYQCSNHSSMMGTITVQSLIPTHHFTFVDSNNPYNARENEFIYSTELITYDPLNGTVGIGTDTARNVGFNNQRGKLHIEGDSVNTSSFALVNNQNTTQSSMILFGKTRGTSTGSVNTVADGDTLGKIAFCPADGTDLENNTAQIKVVVNGTVSGNQIPTDITFETSPSNSANRTEKLRIGSSGQIGLSGENYGTTGQVLTSQGPNSAPVWDSTSASGLTDILVDYTGRSAPCAMPITISTPSAGTKQINIPASSNAYGAKYVGPTEPTGNTVCEGDIWYDTSAASGSPTLSNGTTRVAVLQDVRGKGTNGGTATAGNWHQRRLNSKIDSTSLVTLVNGTTGKDGTANTFSLEAGTYFLQWRAPGFDAGKMIAKMAYTTDPNYNTLFNSQSSAGVSYLSGETAQTTSSTSTSTTAGDLYATGSATVTINQTTYFRLQHYVSTVALSAPQTLGRNNDISGEDEIYSQVIVQDLETAVKSQDTGTTKVAILKDQKNQGVPGGNFTAFGWRDRDLTVEEDPSNFVDFTAGGSQSSGSAGNTPGYWSLPAGTYKIEWSCPGNDVSRHKTRLVYSTTESQISTAGLDASASFVEGSSENTSSSSTTSEDTPDSSNSVGYTVITLTQTTWFKILHYSTTTDTTYGFGHQVRGGGITTLGPEIYSQVRIEDLATAVKDSGGSGSGISGITVEDEGVALSTLATTLNFVGDGVVASGTGAEKTITISGGGNSFVLLSEKTATGNEVEFTGIPSDAQEITLMFKGVSGYWATDFGQTNDFKVQLGTSSGYITSGYVSNSENSQGTDNISYTDGFAIFVHVPSAALHGSMIINKASSNSYTEIGGFRRSNSGGTHARGSLSSVSGTIDRLKIKITNNKSFDGGTISVSYKTSGSGGGHDANKIEQGNTKAEVIDTGTDGKFVVTTEGVERVIVDPSGYLNTRADIRLRRTGSNDGGIYFGDSQNNYIFGADSVEVLTFATGGTGDFVVGETVTGASSGKTATVKSWNSSTRQLTIYNKTGPFTIPEIVTGISASWTTASFSTSEEDVLTFATAGVEKLRIKGITDTTYANCDDILLNNGGGVATTNNVTGVINMGSSYKDGTLGAGSGHWSAVKLHLWKNNTGTTNASTINNVYGLGVSNGMMEIQTDANLGFFVGNDGTESGSRLERMRINTAGLLSIGSAGALINESGLGVRSAGNTCVLKSEGNINHNPLICWNSHGSGMRKLIQFGHSGTYTSNGSITTNGTATYYNASSDYRMKQDEVLITDGIEKVKLLKPRRFKWKSNLDLGMCDGFFAHEIEEATPASQATIGAKDAVATESDVNVGLATSIGDPIYQQIDQSKLIPVLTAALKEAIAKIETLEARIAALEG